MKRFYLIILIIYFVYSEWKGSDLNIIEIDVILKFCSVKYKAIISFNLNLKTISSRYNCYFAILCEFSGGEIIFQLLKCFDLISEYRIPMFNHFIGFGTLWNISIIVNIKFNRFLIGFFTLIQTLKLELM